MIINVNNFNFAVTTINENRAILPANAEAVDLKMSWLQNLRMQTWVKRVCFKNPLLLFKSSSEIMCFQIF